MTDPRTIQSITERVAETMQKVLSQHVKKDIAGGVFWVYPDTQRIIISVDPLSVKNLDAIMSKRFLHLLSTALHNRRVILTNSVGVFYQISYTPKPVSILQSLPLRLDQQPTPLSVPIGMTKNGPLWIDIQNIETALIAGSRGMGKSTLLHGWIQALVFGGETELYLWDGKQNAEFGRYHTVANVNKDLDKVLTTLSATITERSNLISEAGFASMKEYNQKRKPLKPVVLFVDEAAMVTDPACQETLKSIVAVGRAWGVHVVIATQRTGVTEVQPLIKANMVTRISFSVPEAANSQVILGRTGAEKLPKRPGLLLMEWQGRMLKAQAFSVTLPEMPGKEPEPTHQELEIFRKAPEGILSIALLMRDGWKQWEARKALEEWERNGWLERGPNNARRLTHDILSTISQTGA